MVWLVYCFTATIYWYSYVLLFKKSRKRRFHYQTRYRSINGIKNVTFAKSGIKILFNNMLFNRITGSLRYTNSTLYRRRSGIFWFNLSSFLPYSITRTWHTQLAVFWIAATWLATGLFLAPMISGKEMKYQVFGINFLFVALLIIVLGSMLGGEWLGVHQFLDLTTNFFFGHQGYEYMT